LEEATVGPPTAGKQLLEKGKTVFQSNGKRKLQAIQESELYEQIGRLKMELDWIKKIIY
jgi:hypothetical protein